MSGSQPIDQASGLVRSADPLADGWQSCSIQFWVTTTALGRRRLSLAGELPASPVRRLALLRQVALAARRAYEQECQLQARGHGYGQQPPAG